MSRAESESMSEPVEVQQLTAMVESMQIRANSKRKQIQTIWTNEEETDESFFNSSSNNNNNNNSSNSNSNSASNNMNIDSNQETKNDEDDEDDEEDDDVDTEMNEKNPKLVELLEFYSYVNDNYPKLSLSVMPFYLGFVKVLRAFDFEVENPHDKRLGHKYKCEKESKGGMSDCHMIEVWNGDLSVKKYFEKRILLGIVLEIIFSDLWKNGRQSKNSYEAVPCMKSLINEVSFNKLFKFKRLMTARCIRVGIDLSDPNISKCIPVGMKQFKQFVTQMKNKDKCMQLMPLDEMQKAWEEVQIIFEFPAGGANFHSYLSSLADQYTDKKHLAQWVDYIINFDCKNMICKMRWWIRQLLDMISFLHSQGVVHRDLKAENIIFDKEDSYNLLKLIDFGLSCMRRLTTEASKMDGTGGYVASSLRDFSRDWFQIACIIWTILTLGEHLHANVDDVQNDGYQQVLTMIARWSNNNNNYINVMINGCSSVVKMLQTKATGKSAVYVSQKYGNSNTQDAIDRFANQIAQLKDFKRQVLNTMVDIVPLLITKKEQHIDGHNLLLGSIFGGYYINQIFHDGQGNPNIIPTASGRRVINSMQQTRIKFSYLYMTKLKDNSIECVLSRVWHEMNKIKNAAQGMRLI